MSKLYDYKIIIGDSLEKLSSLPDESVHCCVTSPPYWGLRDYGVSGQIGLEDSIAIYLQKLVLVFDQVHRVLRSDGTLWVNMGDSYVTPANTKGAHFATYPQGLVRPCLLAGCPPGGTVLDPFSGSGTTGIVAMQLGLNYIGIELNPDYAKMSLDRLAAEKSKGRQMKIDGVA